MSELSIKITIAGRVYPLTIQMDEEESIRKASKMINDNIKDLESNYAVKDKQDLLAMAALQYAVQAATGSVNTMKEEKINIKILETDRKLADYFDTF